MRTKIRILFLTTALLASGAIAQQPSQQDLDLQAAIRTENIDGDLKGAIQQYQRILAGHPKDRSVAATALLHIGECYEKLGQSEAQSAYERLLHDYADQSAEANEARARLAALNHSSPGTEMVAQRLWAGPQTDFEGGVTADGRLLSYTDWDTGDLAVRDLVTGQNRHVTHKGSWADSQEEVEMSVPSPNGAQIAYTWYTTHDSYELRVIDTDGSNMRVLYHNPKVDYLEPKSWSPDGKEIVGTFWEDGNQKAEIMVVSTTDGSTRILKSGKTGAGGGFHAEFSPDGRYIAYDLPQHEGSSGDGIYAVPANGGTETPIVQGSSDNILLGWSPDGTGIVFASNRLGPYGVWSMDVHDGKQSGSPRLLNANVGQAWPLGVSRDGSLYYGIGTPVWDVNTASFSFTDGKILQAPALVSPDQPGRNLAGAWSPDGKYLAYLSRRRRSDRYRPDSIVIRSLESGQERELIPGLKTIYPGGGLRWSADGRAFYIAGMDKSGPSGMFRVDGKTGEASALFGNDIGVLRARRFEEVPGGNSFVVERTEYSKQADDELILRNQDTGQQRVLFHIARPTRIGELAISHDGQQLAFTTGEGPGGTSTLRVIPVAGGDARVLLQLKTPEVVSSLAWTPDGSQIVFVKSDGRLTHDKSELMEISANGGEPRDLGLSLPRMTRVGIHPDGHRIVFQTHSNTGEVWVIRNLFAKSENSR